MGASLADGIADVAEADVISVTVLNDEQVRDVIAGEQGLARFVKPGTVIAIHSTIGDDHRRRSGAPTRARRAFTSSTRRSAVERALRTRVNSR